MQEFKNSLFTILREQNYWFKEFTLRYISRPVPPNMIHSKSIAVIKGPRRAGKTFLLKQIINELINGGVDKSQILYLNLEDYRLYRHYNLELLELALEVYRENINPDKNMYFLIDEIQNIDEFERFLRTKYDLQVQENIKFFITGSNSKLLSKELGTLLTGRIISYELLPFSFNEFLTYHDVSVDTSDFFTIEPQKSKILYLFNKYIHNGSIPEFFDETDPKERLLEYLDNVLYRDIVERYNIRNSRLVKELTLNLITNCSKRFSINKLKNILGCSINTVQDYIADLEMAYLFFYISKFSHSVKEKTTSQSKVYCIDTGLMNMMSYKFSDDYGRLLENLVFLELRRQKKDVYYYSDESCECDFIVREKLKPVQAIQVTKSLENKKTRERELKGLLKAVKKLNIKSALILTENESNCVEIDNFKVIIKPVWLWLLENGCNTNSAG